MWLEVHVTCSSVIPSHGRLEFNMCRQHILFNLKKIYICSNFYKGANASVYLQDCLEIKLIAVVNLVLIDLDLYQHKHFLQTLS